MAILVTGAAGFIGYFVSQALLEAGHTVIGIDNINDYYAADLKLNRLQNLGIDKNLELNAEQTSNTHPGFKFIKGDITNASLVEQIFKDNSIHIVCHLAAQPGVRYSIINPDAYVHSNINGFFNIIKIANAYGVDLFLYASSSSVYGNSNAPILKETDDTGTPVSFYAATKKSNELMAYTYAHIYKLKTIGVRFFTVYGPWGRPDMAYYSFTKNILEGKPIQLFNFGKLQRDFTYISDIVAALVKIIESKGSYSKGNYNIYNISNHETIELNRFVHAIETALQREAKIELLPMQIGDVESTFADISTLQRDYQYKPTVDIESGIKMFVQWYLSYQH